MGKENKKKSVLTKLWEFIKFTVVPGVLLILVIGLYWLITCGVVKLLTLCFELAFTWKAATGVWIITMCMYGLFGTKKGNSK